MKTELHMGLLCGWKCECFESDIGDLSDCNENVRQALEEVE